MKHLLPGEIRAAQDGELAEGRRRQVQQHLEACPHCRLQAGSLLERSQAARARLEALDPPPGRAPISARAARLQLEDRLSGSQKEQKPMRSKFFSSRFRLAWAILGLVGLLAFALAFPSVRAIANSFLGLFRVQQISAVRVNPSNLPNQLGSSARFEAMIAQDFTFEEDGLQQTTAGRDEAAALAGIPVRLPAGAQVQPDLIVQPGGKMKLTVDQERLKALLAEIGRSDVQLPAALDGAEVTLDLPRSVIAAIGECSEPYRSKSGQPVDPDIRKAEALISCTTLIQMASPTITAPPGLDLPQIGEAYLEVMGMSREDAAAFASNVDWTTTLVIPIPGNQGDYRDVTVSGVPGTLVTSAGKARFVTYTLIWVKDGVVYALTGPGDGSNALELAESLQ